MSTTLEFMPPRHKTDLATPTAIATAFTAGAAGAGLAVGLLGHPIVSMSADAAAAAGSAIGYYFTQERARWNLDPNLDPLNQGRFFPDDQRREIESLMRDAKKSFGAASAKSGVAGFYGAAALPIWNAASTSSTPVKAAALAAAVLCGYAAYKCGKAVIKDMDNYNAAKYGIAGTGIAPSP